jgi:uncharacterized membrane protein YdjX (TVP38/TMEM64 family)
VDRDTRGQLILLGVMAALGLAAWAARSALGIEWSAESLRELVARQGAWGPVLFILLVAFRPLLFVPSQILLVAGGLCFGARAGALYGAAGIALCGAMVFSLARWAGREAVLASIPPQMRWALDAAGSRAGALVLVVGTAWPVGPVTAYHAGAGLTRMPVALFLVCLAIGALLRGALYAYFGSALAEAEAWEMVAAGVLLLGATALPLVHPRSRNWLRARLGIEPPPG